MSVELLNQRREKRERGSSLESRVSALESYMALLIGTSELVNGAVTTPKIADSAVNVDKLLTGCVTELKIADAAVKAAKVDLLAIDALGNLTSGSVDTTQLVNDAVTGLKLLNGAVTAAKTAVAGIDSLTGNVTANHIIANMIQANAVTAAKINASAVTADKIAANAVTAVKILANAVTSDKINVSTLSAITANCGSITAGTITGATVRTNSATYPKAVMNSSGLTINGQYLTFKNTSGSSGGEIFQSNTYGFMMSSFSGNNLYINSAYTLTLNAGGGDVYIKSGTSNRIYAGASYIKVYDNFLSSSSTNDIGSSVSYFGEINYKTWADRGCLGWFDKGVELRDGKIVSDIEALQAIKKHPTKKTIYGIPMLDYKTLPKVSYLQADEKIKDKNGKLIKRKMLPRDKNDQPYQMIKNEETGKMEKIEAQDGAEMTSMFSIMIGALKEIDNRLTKLERRTI